jgi:hypothetical protein
MDLVPHLSGALLVPDYGALLVADLHLEKGSSLARRGVYLPPYDTRQSLLQLEAVVAAVRPRRLVFLGDSFHDQEARQRLDVMDLERLRALTAGTPAVWLSGNHDPSPPGDLGGTIATELRLGPLVLRHEPHPLAAEECEIAGHLHPAAAIEARGRLIRCRCFVADGRRLILPAFGSYTGALNVLSEAFSGLFGDYHVWMLGSAAIHRFPAQRLR